MLKKTVDIDYGVIVLKNNDVVYHNKVADKILNDIKIGTIKEFVSEILHLKRQDLLQKNIKISIHDIENYKIIILSKNKTELIRKLSYEVNELEAIMEDSFDEIFVTDGNGYTLKINKAAEENYGIPRNKIIGKHVSELENSGYFNPSLTLKALAKKKRVTDVQITNKGKTLVVTSNPIIDEHSGKIIRVVTNSRDITELMTLQKKLQNSQDIIKTYQSIISNANCEENSFIISDDVMKSIMKTITKVSNTDSTILLEGETGVGKNMIAKRIHMLSARKNKPLIYVNCAAIPINLMETELFGYEGGSFTGAKNAGKKGLLEAADNGTAFFDEITEIPIQIQSKLLDILQSKHLRRVGSNKYININVRIISATNKDLKHLVQQKLFREDLFYRLNVIPITIPPLRYRKEAVQDLALYFLKKYNAKYNYKKIMSKAVLHCMQQYIWPGNIRELENLMERLVVTTNSKEISANDLPAYINTDNNSDNFVNKDLNLKEAVRYTEYRILKEALNRFDSTYKIANALNVNQSTIVRKMKKLNLTKNKNTG